VVAIEDTPLASFPSGVDRRVGHVVAGPHVAGPDARDTNTLC